MELTQLQKACKEYAIENDGKTLKNSGVSRSFVVNSNVPEELWGNIGMEVVPLRPRRTAFILKKVQKDMENHHGGLEFLALRYHDGENSCVTTVFLRDLLIDLNALISANLSSSAQGISNLKTDNYLKMQATAIYIRTGKKPEEFKNESPDNFPYQAIY
ncbi:MAG: hypothetical protein HPY85_13130 [Anaerolineae bacterium]|nr:hypothetical protein [Anaerolineae bacterium]